MFLPHLFTNQLEHAGGIGPRRRNDQLTVVHNQYAAPDFFLGESLLRDVYRHEFLVFGDTHNALPTAFPHGLIRFLNNDSAVMHRDGVLDLINTDLSGSCRTDACARLFGEIDETADDSGEPNRHASNVYYHPLLGGCHGEHAVPQRGRFRTQPDVTCNRDYQESRDKHARGQQEGKEPHKSVGATGMDSSVHNARL